MKTLTSILFILSFSLITIAQSNRDKIKTLKIAYITEKLDLSEKEAQKFWPIYNTYEEENTRLRKEAYEARKRINFETITEEEAKEVLKENRLKDNKRQAIENEFFNNLSKVISAKKIILLHKTEDDFKRKIFDEYKKRGRS
ncbi:hypothetical protein QLS71_002075 [Mariniflexile litorale]|uniref:Sensor of ECF-type sigma factor n=1 Tax=Mariniflexile litorale TaxID=3045158 RepID=A0AAU7EI54_9FLAO|nr:hypothetical protein [Mariniflexile sp. KMM 9835]MDQ8210743.1 hypothetical protein [Mariniflexile sp. KMM 9835]